MTSCLHPDHTAAVLLLQTPLLSARTAPYIDESWIDWEALFAELSPRLSRSERLLVDAAFDLSGGEPRRRLSLRDLALSLDGSNFHTLVGAMFARRAEHIDLSGR